MEDIHYLQVINLIYMKYINLTENMFDNLNYMKNKLQITHNNHLHIYKIALNFKVCNYYYIGCKGKKNLDHIFDNFLLYKVIIIMKKLFEELK
jgi:hypothetical protein